MNKIRILIGAAIWCVLAIAAIALISRRELKSESPSLIRQMGQYALANRRVVELKLESPQLMRHGDPIFVDINGESKRIGEIVRVASRDSTEMEAVKTDTAFAQFYPSAPDVFVSDHLTYHSTPREIGWVVKMMLPPDTRKKIGDMISKAYAKHQQEIVLNLRPVVEAAMREAIPVIEEDLRAAFARREVQWKKIGARYREEIVEKDLIPLIEEHIWPIVREESKPLTEKVGEEIWNKASLMRFGWRVIYDATPLPKRDLTKKEFERFVEEDGLPVIQNHMGDLIDLQQQILSRISKNEKVREVVGNSLMKIIDDRQVQQLVVEIVEEVFVKNKRLVDIFQKHWNSEQGRAAMQITSERLEPTIAAIGEELFGNPRKEITPEFSRVLRFKILKKDARWLVLKSNHAQLKHPVEKGEFLNVHVAPTSTENPFHFERD